MIEFPVQVILKNLFVLAKDKHAQILAHGIDKQLLDLILEPWAKGFCKISERSEECLYYILGSLLIQYLLDIVSDTLQVGIASQAYSA